MPRYYFHIHDGRSEPDEDGTEFADEAAARREAIRFAGRIMDDEAHRIALGERWHLVVADDRGATLFRIDFSVTEMQARASSPQFGPGSEPNRETSKPRTQV